MSSTVEYVGGPTPGISSRQSGGPARCVYVPITEANARYTAWDWARGWPWDTRDAVYVLGSDGRYQYAGTRARPATNEEQP